MTDPTPTTEAGLVRFHPKSEVTMEAVPDGLWVTYDNAVKAIAEARATDSLCMAQYAKGRADERKRIADAVRAIGGEWLARIEYDDAPEGWFDGGAGAAVISGLEPRAARIRAAVLAIVEGEG